MNTTQEHGSSIQNRFSCCQVQCTRCILCAKLILKETSKFENLSHKIQIVQKIQKHFSTQENSHLTKATYLKYGNISFELNPRHAKNQQNPTHNYLAIRAYIYA